MMGCRFLSLPVDFRRYFPAAAKVTPAAACWDNQLASHLVLRGWSSRAGALLPSDYQSARSAAEGGGWVIQVRVSCERHPALVLRQVREREREEELSSLFETTRGLILPGLPGCRATKAQHDPPTTASPYRSVYSLPTLYPAAVGFSVCNMTA